MAAKPEEHLREGGRVGRGHGRGYHRSYSKSKREVMSNEIRPVYVRYSLGL